MNLKFDQKGLVPVIVQDWKKNDVLMLAYMNKVSLRKTMKTKEMWYWSRSRKVLWHKGETSGHIQVVKEVAVDCENNSLLFIVEQKVAGCHAGYFSCYYQKVNSKGELEITEKLVFDPKKVY